MAILHDNINNLKQAIAELEEALAIYHRMEEYTYVDKNRVLQIENFLKTLRTKNQQNANDAGVRPQKSWLSRVFNKLFRRNN